MSLQGPGGYGNFDLSLFSAVQTQPILIQTWTSIDRRDVKLFRVGDELFCEAQNILRRYQRTALPIPNNMPVENYIAYLETMFAKIQDDGSVVFFEPEQVPLEELIETWKLEDGRVVRLIRSKDTLMYDLDSYGTIQRGPIEIPVDCSIDDYIAALKTLSVSVGENGEVAFVQPEVAPTVNVTVESPPSANNCTPM